MTTDRRSLTRFAWLSIVGAIATISLKALAYWITGSVGLLSDAFESLVNLAAGCAALVALIIATRPADDDHQFGHEKAEYFSSGFEGGLILLAALGIAYAAVERLLNPQAIDQVPLGVAVSAVASIINFGIARTLFKAAHRQHSITLEAAARHLMTDVWTSVGVIVGVAAVGLTGWQRLDPIIALAVAANIVWTGIQLLRRSAFGLMDTALPLAEQARIRKILDQYRAQGIQYHALRTRGAPVRRFVSVHILVPGAWSVKQGHDLLEKIESEICAELENATVFTHLEPVEDPASWQDLELDRTQGTT
ncbi:MAG: cation diffusion facilitator family transporter [Burkholderiales bacterium]